MYEVEVMAKKVMADRQASVRQGDAVRERTGRPARKGGKIGRSCKARQCKVYSHVKTGRHGKAGQSMQRGRFAGIKGKARKAGTAGMQSRLAWQTSKTGRHGGSIIGNQNKARQTDKAGCQGRRARQVGKAGGHDRSINAKHERQDRPAGIKDKARLAGKASKVRLGMGRQSRKAGQVVGERHQFVVWS